jgi:hypothetical protein
MMRRYLGLESEGLGWVEGAVFICLFVSDYSTHFPKFLQTT